VADLNAYLEVHRWDAPGYQPLVFSAGWQAALLNWEPAMDLASLSEIERHNQTDEVFVLWRGRGALFISTDEGMTLLEMKAGEVVNVRRGTWHGVLADRQASWVIVEGRDAHLNDTEIRKMDQAELASLKRQLPAWLA
jgi:hypothetical protein